MVNTEELLKLKELLDNGAITQEEFEQQKARLFSVAEPAKEKPRKKIGLFVAIAAVVIVCIAIIGSNDSDTQDSSVASGTMQQTETAQAQPKQPQVPAEFAQECPVSVSASMYDNIIGMPELECNIKNLTDREIAAVKLYFAPKDVYGEELEGIFTTNHLYTDNPIAAGSSANRSWQLLDSEVKSGDVYVYSVYFTDGTEWGDKEATTSIVKKHGQKISVSY